MMQYRANEIISQEIEIMDHEVDLSRRFARRCVETNAQEYARRGQTNTTRIKEQIAVGKVAEFALWRYLTAEWMMTDLVSPDIGVYEATDKSYDADLKRLDEGERIHVKAQEADKAKKYGSSWIFQQNDPLVREPGEKDFVACCEIRKWDRVTLCGLFEAKRLGSVYGLPEVPFLRKTKLALYREDLEQRFSAAGNQHYDTNAA